MTSVGHIRNGVLTVAAESRMPTRDEHFPVATCDEAHLAHVIGCSVSGNGAVAETDGVELMTGSWLLVSSPASVSFSGGIWKASVGLVEPRLWLITFRN